VTATVDSRNRFEAKVNLDPGPQTVPVVATDPSDSSSMTHNYQVNVTGGSPRNYGRDSNGNITSSTSPDGSGAPNATYEWDAADRLSAINMGAHRTELQYDGLGRRVHLTEKDSGVITGEKRFLWIGNELSEERGASGGAVTKRFFGQGEQRIGGSDAGIYFFTRDHLGSVREVTDSNSAVQARYDYNVWGERTKLAGTLDFEFAFTGFYFHNQSGLSFSGTRAYDSTLAKWISRDPIAETGGFNLYQYVVNNPIQYRDPLGLFGEDVHRGAPGQNYGTYTWARELGYSDQVARDIGRANIETDDGSTGPWPLSSKSGGRARHFDIPLGGDDSRDAWAWTEMNNALNLWKTDRCKAYEALGRGLHSIQDKFAHGDWDNDHHPWKYHGDWMDNWQGRPDVHGPVERATKAYLQYFLNMVRP
jgi:RHS repeat-associated protein